MKIDTELFKDLVQDSYDGDEWMVIEDKLTGTWRWGSKNRAILKRTGLDGVETFWGYDYRIETSHDEHRIILEDSEVELWKAVAVPVATTEYREES